MKTKAKIEGAAKIKQPLYYVGIGASAGGLEALRPFVANLPAESNMTYIVAQHMSPDHRSLMVELLARETKLSVEGAKHGITPQKNTIYVCPPNMDVTVHHGEIQLSKPSNTIGPKPSVNRFFISLAEDQEEKSIGIVLSGTGSDAAHGIKAIKAAGGITIAQEPKTSKYDSMPNAAIRIGGADLILPPNDIASQLSLIILRPQTAIDAEQSLIPSTIREIIQQIITSTGMDFTNYKEATLSRQITRRMTAKQIHSIESYGDYISKHPKELHELANNFLICVTSFFRDPVSFDAIKERIKIILDNKPSGSDIRIWVPGCATGEEVYSLAIILNEELQSRQNTYRAQIFATDINNEAVLTARAGIYPEAALAGLDDKIISKYFSIQNDMYSINKNIKDIVLFAKQNLVQDPPFVRLDLISCRNLLIYFKSELQENVMKLFHYCLRDKGVLFLGQSETIGKQTDLFSEIDRKNKIYAKRQGITATISGLSKNRTPLTLNTTTNEQIETISNESLGQERLFQLYAPASILVTDNGDILEIFGDCSHFLSIKSGKANFNLYTLIRQEFRAEIRAFIHRVSHGHESESGSITTLTIDGKEHRYRLVIHPLNEDDHSTGKLLLVSFEPVTSIQLVGDSSHSDTSHAAIERIATLEQEIVLNRENLQTVIEELETANEELQSVNEEAQAGNEELQASNEELETANEELQASNEELITVNDELNSRSLELSRANSDMNNILDAIYKALLVIDKDLKITRHNKMASQFFDMSEGRTANIARIKPRYDMPNLLSDIQEVLHTGKTIESEFSALSNQYFLIRIMPYNEKNDDDIGGIIITIVDISKHKAAEEKLRLSASVFDHASEATLITDADNKIISINPAFTRITGYTAEEIIGKDPKILSANQQSKEFYTRMWDSISKQGSWAGELVNKRKNGELYNEWLSVNVLKDENGQITRHTAVFSDISEAKKIREVVERQANYDTLTELPNRNLTLDRLNQLLLSSRREKQKFGVMFLDLDNFKSINDTLGHNIGDELLITIAMRLKDVLRDADSIGRLGGDEFIILLNNLASEQDAITIANKALSEINRPMLLSGHSLQISASIGITIYPMDGDSSEELMKNADNAMYESKKRGRNMASFFTQEMQNQANKVHWIEQELTNTLHNRQLELYYQPVIDIQSMEVIGAEALSRWAHPQKGFISPIDFIPVAENRGLIHELSEWVVDTSLDTARAWDPRLSVAINLSVAQFSSNSYLNKLITQLKHSPLAKQGRIIIEITESIELVENAQYLKILHQLKDSGCRIAIDDFGTGYSSLSYLSRLPVDIIKIDQSFIRDISIDEADRKMVKVILQIAKEFGLDIIAEGVETQEQLEFLRINGCDKAQGYLFSPATSHEKFNQFLDTFDKGNFS